jgi:hypothetical protein
MRATRTFLVLITVCGIAASLWMARPVDPSEIWGWLFAGFSSLAWFVALLLCFVAIKLNRSALAIGGVVVLGLSEVLTYIYVQDPLFLVMKPIYQTFLLALGAAFGAPFKSQRHVDA